MRKDKKYRKDVWSSYWQKSVIESCAGFIQSDESDIERFWEVCSQEISSSDQVLDLCMGKGAVIKSILNQKTLAKEDFPLCYGVDLASYSEQLAWLEPYRANVRLLLNTSIEDIPLKDNSIDHCVSQFGIEYALSEATYSELLRLLKPKAKLSLVIHHSDSILINVARQEIEQIDFLVDEIGVFEKVEKMIPFFVLLRNPANISKLNKSAEAQHARQEYNQNLTAIKANVEKFINPDILQESLNIFSNCLQLAKEKGKKTAVNFLKNYQKELLDSSFRSNELIDCAMGKAELDSFLARLGKEMSIDYEISELKSNHRLVAWGVKVNLRD
ncbi:methyltransferase domain-containing protein [Kangiella sp. TOML190]|uniref:methyltransferase domain-containing protein n=1 Tax=Kangiella sp. TOML190 TaxID=2931351 RepID=UPI00203F8DC7|nr:methyltransferase domain-containing protein [Kangiella sp. TOML190]